MGLIGPFARHCGSLQQMHFQLFFASQKFILSLLANGNIKKNIEVKNIHPIPFLRIFWAIVSMWCGFTIPAAAQTTLFSTGFESMMLGDAVPNPSTKESKIGILLPDSEQQAVLQFVDFGSGNVLQTIPLQARGKLETVLDVSKAPSGLYGYRLVSDGKPEAVKKLIVMH